MRINITLDKEQKISQATLDALEAELYRNLQPIYPKTAIRIRKGSANGVELSGLKLDEDKKRVMEIMQQVWEDDSWLHEQTPPVLKLAFSAGGVEQLAPRGASSSSQSFSMFYWLHTSDEWDVTLAGFIVALWQH